MEQYFKIILCICNQIKTIFEKNRMRSNKASRHVLKLKQKQLTILNLQSQLRRQLSPLAKLIDYGSSNTNSKSKKLRSVFKSARYTSPNSYQSSQIVSKKQSRQKNNGLMKKNGSTGRLQMKKINIRKNSKPKIKQIQKQNKDKNLDNAIAQKFKITKWKNKILKQFVVYARDDSTDQNSVNYLQRSLKLYSESKQISSKSFFGYLLGEGHDQSKKTSLIGANRILTIDWLYLISASLLLSRETVHLAIHYLDSYYLIKQDSQKVPQQNIHIIAAAALFLSVKQQQRDLQSILLQTLCMSEKYHVIRQQVIQSQKAILAKLNFRLKSNTVAFWIDYFSMKWDLYVESVEGRKAIQQTNFDVKVKLRSSDGDCYRVYRELVQLSDVCLMFGDYIVFQKCKLSLACLYLVIRIESQRTYLPQTETESSKYNNIFKTYHKLFMKKASPIFKDPYRINQIFNGFLTEICQFEITQIIPCIKFVANFLQLEFCYNIDEKSIEETKSYQDFIRRMTYSFQMKDYCLLKIC